MEPKKAKNRKGVLELFAHLSHMLTVEGIYKDGKVELLEAVTDVTSSKVLVTFIEDSDIELEKFGIDEEQAAELREKFGTFDDWNDPALDVYNRYDDAKSTLGQVGVSR